MSSVNTLYGTPEERQSLAAGAAANSAFKLLLRTARAPAVQRGRRVVARRAVHDRGVGGVRGADGHAPDAQEEELGRLELVRAGTGRLAPLTAAVIVALDSR